MDSADSKETVLMISVFAIVVAASGADLVADLAHGAGIDHIVKESAVVVISALAIARLLWGLRRQRQEIEALQQELVAANDASSQPRKYVLEARKKLGNVVSQQFSEWGLTDSEKEIGWLLLKGLSLKEIALLRDTQEKTVRQQASAVYRKAGVAGRHAFSAWFIEDIL